EWVLRHLCVYLIGSQKSYPTLLKHFYRLREVCFGISHGIGFSGHAHSLCWNIHFVDCVKKPARSRKEHLMGLLRRNKKSMGDVAGNQNAFPGSHYEDFAAHKKLHLARKKIEKFMFSRVDMGRWFAAASHLNDSEVKRSVVIHAARHFTD